MDSHGQIINWPEISRVERKGIMDFPVPLAASSPEPSGHLLIASLPTINLKYCLPGRLEFLDPSRRLFRIPRLHVRTLAILSN